MKGIAVDQRQVNTQKTDQHVRILGTNFYLIPPKDFIPATNYHGFEHPKTGASIYVTEVPRNYKGFTNAFTAETLAASEIILKEKEVILLNQNPAFFAKLEQWSEGSQYITNMLAFGNDTTTYVVKGTFRKLEVQIDKDIQEAIFSIFHDSNQAVDPLESISFSIDTAGTSLKLAKNLTGTLIYTFDGIVPTKSDDHTMFVITRSFENKIYNDQKFAAIDRLKKLPYSDIKISESQNLEINGLRGYEILGDGVSKVNGIIYHVSFLMLFDNEGYYLVIGTTNKTSSEHLELFRKICRTFKKGT